MIKGIIFDFDGLICDTETPELKAWGELFAEYDQPFPLNEYLKTIGSIYNDDKPVLILKELVDFPIDAEKLTSDFLVLKRKLMDQEPLRPGVLSYLHKAKQGGFKLGLASSAPDEWVIHHVNRLGIIHFFDCIKTSEDVKKTKPDPELYIRTLKCMQVFPHEAIALEDSPNGINAAIQAGVNVVAVPNSVTRIFNFDSADLVVDSLEDLCFEDLLTHFNLI